MMAGLGPEILRAFRWIGLPAEPLPEVGLLVRGVGRFVLIHSGIEESRRAAHQAIEQGFEILDFADWQETEVLFDPATENETAWSVWLTRLKSELESRGGLWLRIGNTPYPFLSSLMPISICNDSSDEVIERTTRFLPANLPEGRLPCIPATPGDYGWFLETHSDNAKLARWNKRLRQLRDVNASVSSLLVRSLFESPPADSELASRGIGLICQFPKIMTPLQWSIAHEEGPLRVPVASTLGEFEGAIRGRIPFVVIDPSEDLLTASQEHLTWITTCRSFLDWIRARNRIKIQATCVSGIHTIEVEPEDSSRLEHPIALELWRGSHRALLPIWQNVLTWRENLIPFESAGDSPPWGNLTLCLPRPLFTPVLVA